MNRIPLAGQILPGKSGEFRSELGRQWPNIVQYLDAGQITNFSIWQAEDLVFVYGEIEGRSTEAPNSLLQPFLASVTIFPYPMRLMYADIGLPRTDKSLIRHRVFMTQLVPGSEEEYKARHDRLSAESLKLRDGAPNPGPDSNFTIWCSNGYIFGYDEIDVTMEHAMTEEERASTIAWETRMFEIMHWITNDCDWISGEHHPAVQRIAHWK